MDVKACDNCKTLNTGSTLLDLIILRKSSSPDRLPESSDPIIGFALQSAPNHVSMGSASTNRLVLCKSCSEKKTKELFALITAE